VRCTRWTQLHDGASANPRTGASKTRPRSTTTASPRREWPAEARISSRSGNNNLDHLDLDHLDLDLCELAALGVDRLGAGLLLLVRLLLPVAAAGPAAANGRGDDRCADRRADDRHDRHDVAPDGVDEFTTVAVAAAGEPRRASFKDALRA